MAFILLADIKPIISWHFAIWHIRKTR